MSFLTRIQLPGLHGLLEIVILALVFYYILLFIHGTRGAQVLSGLALVFVSLMILTYLFSLDTLNWLLQRFSVYLAVAVVVIFQPEIRRFLAELGRRHVFTSNATDRSVVDKLVKAATLLADRKIGALIAVEREVGLRPVIESGTVVDGVLSPEMLAGIFFPHTPLHDGGVIVKDNRLVAAGCVFPLSQREELGKSLGTRHRAAIGLTEESDALVLVVSEETGAMSVAYRGRLRRGLDEERLRRVLGAVLLKGRSSAGESARRPGWRTLRAWWAHRVDASLPKKRGEEHVSPT